MYYLSNAASLVMQLNVQERLLSSWQKKRNDSVNKLAEMKSAQADLKRIHNQHNSVFKAAYSYPSKIVAMDSLGLIGVEKIQEGVSAAYTGPREQKLLTSVTTILTSLQTKITNEEGNITTYTQKISNTKNAIDSLQKKLASAV